MLTCRADLGMHCHNPGGVEVEMDLRGRQHSTIIVLLHARRVPGALRCRMNSSEFLR